MRSLFILPIYLNWHYTKAPFRVISLGVHFVSFILYLFSVKILLKTFFSPWRRLSEDYSEGITNPGEIAASLVVNTMMRFVGAVIRTVTIVIALILSILVIVSSLVLFVYWLLLPFAVVFLIIASIGIMIFF